MILAEAFAGEGSHAHPRRDVSRREVSAATRKRPPASGCAASARVPFTEAAQSYRMSPRRPVLGFTLFGFGYLLAGFG